MKFATFFVMCSKIYGKEKTLKSYQESGVRLQLVLVGLDFPFPNYEVRKNRKLIFRSFDFIQASSYFRNYMLDIVNQLPLC